MRNEAQTELASVLSGVLDKRSTPLVSVGALEQALLQVFPEDDAEEWDQTGLLVGRRDVAIDGVCIALDATLDAIRATSAKGANVLVTHHPIFLDAPEKFTPADEGRYGSGDVVFEAISEGVSCMNFHTALDVSPLAASVLPSMLGLEFSHLLCPLPSQPTKGYGHVCSFPGDTKMNLEQLAARCVSVFGRLPRVYGKPSQGIERICTATGSASSLIEHCLRAHVDVLICGEVRYHAALDACAAGLGIIELGHDVSELPFSALLAQVIGFLGVPESKISLLDQGHNWWTPEALRQ